MAEDANKPSELIFVGGTGRSGTHVVARLLGSHSRYRKVPIECRFHCNERGLADVVSGRATPGEFVAKLRGFWWHRARLGARATVRFRRLARGSGRLPGADAKVRGLHKIIAPDRFEEAVRRFEASCDRDVVQAARDLFYDLLQPLADEAGKPALIEMSCFTIAAAPGLARIFPEARFVHAVRDGRDAGSSKVGKRQKRHHPTEVGEGIAWWEERLRLAEEGVRGLPDRGLLHAVSLDELVWGDREPSYRDLLEFLEIEEEPAMREYFETRMNAANAHRERWREGLTEDEQVELQARYETALGRIERDGYHCAALLRRTYERERAPAG
jgi:hypothetical protein